MLPSVSHYLVYAGLLASNADVTQEHNSSGTSAGIACCHVNNRRLLSAPVAVRLLGPGLRSLRLPARKTISWFVSHISLLFHWLPADQLSNGLHVYQPSRSESMLKPPIACKLDRESEDITKFFSFERRTTSIASKRAYNSARKMLAVSGSRTHLVLTFECLILFKIMRFGMPGCFQNISSIQFMCQSQWTTTISQT